jgi:hypothetical protein
MNPPPAFLPALLLGILLPVIGGVMSLRGAEQAQAREAPPVQAEEDDGAIPRALQESAFDALLTGSPFTRSLGVSDSLILTGVVHVEDDVLATLLDTRTQESQLVSRQPNFKGWRLVGLAGSPERMQTWTARVQTPGGEVVSVRYQKPPPRSGGSKSGAGGGSSAGGASGGRLPPLSDSQIKEARLAAENYKEGFSSDGYPRQPPPEMVAKLSRLSTGQREEINREMLGHRNRGLGLDDRRKIYEGLVDRAVQRR